MDPYYQNYSNYYFVYHVINLKIVKTIFFLVTTGVRCIKTKPNKNRSAISALLGAISCQFHAAYSNNIIWKQQ